MTATASERGSTYPPVADPDYLGMVSGLAIQTVQGRAAVVVVGDLFVPAVDEETGGGHAERLAIVRALSRSSIGGLDGGMLYVFGNSCPDCVALAQAVGLRGITWAG